MLDQRHEKGVVLDQWYEKELWYILWDQGPKWKLGKQYCQWEGIVRNIICIRNIMLLSNWLQGYYVYISCSVKTFSSHGWVQTLYTEMDYFATRVLPKNQRQ